MNSMLPTVCVATNIADLNDKRGVSRYVFDAEMYSGEILHEECLVPLSLGPFDCSLQMKRPVQSGRSDDCTGRVFCSITA